MQLVKEQVQMSAQELVDVIAVAARYEWMKKHPVIARIVVAMRPTDWDEYIDGCMRRDHGDGLPTMGDQAEEEMTKWACWCGQPSLPGVLHKTNEPCKLVETAHEF